MGKRNRVETYYGRKQAAETKSGQKTYNIQQATRDKLGVQTDWEVYTPLDVKTYNEAVREFGFQEDYSRDTPPTYQTMTAPTTNPPRPRALKIAYSRQAEKLVVKFRDNTWWEYNGIPVDIWNDLKSSNSTGKYLSASGLDTYDDMGPFNPDEMTEETRVLFNA
jgi:hypothetical protein